MSKFSLPALTFVIAIIAVTYGLVRTMSPDNRVVSMAESDSAVDRKQPATASVDKEGRYVVMLGEVEMRVPMGSRSKAPMASYDWFRADLCRREVDQIDGPGCRRLMDRITIYLMARPLDIPPPVCNVNESITNELLAGPFPTSNALVDLYQSESGITREYVYRLEEEDCRFPKASCSPLKCRVAFHLQPGVDVRYEFQEDDVAVWPEIHERVLIRAYSHFPDESDQTRNHGPGD